MFCRNCGEEIPDSSRFCPKCGTKVEVKRNSTKCPACGAEIEDGSKFCEHCGTPVSLQEESEVKTQSVQTNKNTRFFDQNQTGHVNFKQSEISTGCKIWFWFMLIVNAIYVVISLSALSYAAGAVIVPLVGCIVNCTGAAFILFKKKKTGFYMCVGVAAVNFIYNLASGYSILDSILGILGPVISYYFIKENANVIK